MSTTTDALQAQLLSWRQSFDQSFTEPREKADWGDTWDVLGIRIANEPFALHLDDLAGLLPAMTPAPYPADAAALLGLIGYRGQVLPLYDLRALLGRGASTTPRWWAIVRATPLALAFEGFDGQWRLPPQDRLQQDNAASDSGSDWTVRAGGELRPLIPLAPLVERLTATLAGGRDAASAHPKA